MSQALHVLIVEDSESDAALVARLLRKAGYDVDAERVEGADPMRAALARQTWDVVIADYRLPQFDAPAALALLQETGLDIPFIVVSGTVGEDTAVAMMKAGAHDYLMKDKLLRLAPAVEREMREAQSRRERRRAETQREAALEALRESEARFSTVFRASPVGICLTRLADGQVTDANPVFLTMMGYTREEVIGHTTLELSMWSDPEERSRVVRLLGEQGRIYNLELRFRRKSGEVGVLLTSAELIDLGGERYMLSLMNDITDRKRVEEALRVSEERFALAVQGSNDGLWDWDLRGQTLYWSPRLKELLGYADDELEVDFDTFTSLLHPADRERVAAAIEAHLKERRAYDVEQLLRTKSGEYRWYRAWGQALWDEAGSPVRMVGFTSDITGRKQAEAALRQRNRELALLNQVIADSTADRDAISILETACRKLAAAFGVPQAAAALLNEDKRSAVVVAEYLAAGRPSALKGAIPVAGNPSFQYLLTHKAPLVVDDAQGDPRLASVHDLMRERGARSLLILPLVVDGEVVGSLGLDAIEPRRFSAEEVSLAWSVADQVAGVLSRAWLNQERRRLDAAVEQAAEGIVILDAQNTIVYVNPAFEQMTGYSRAEAVGRKLDFLRSGKHDETLYQELWATTGAGQAWHGRIVNRKKDGSLYTDETSITPVRNESGAIVNYVAIKRDVTQELQLEEQYRQAQKMEAVGQLTAGIAHDFNNLLTAINGFAELARLELGADEPAQELLGKVRDSGRRAADLVRQLLAFSRKQIIQPQVLDLNDVVTHMNRMLQRVIGEHIDLKISLAPELWPVKVDPSQIEQVIVNLAVNARDAMPGGGHLTIETANVLLDEDYAASHLGVQPGEYVLLAVSDTGVGMSQEVQAHIFEPFFTTKGRGKGTGLGLSTVYGIVKQSGGNIWVDSEEGVGTAFKIYLPRAEEAARPLPGPEAEGGMPSGSETILLVEDAPGVRELAGRVLKAQGYTVLEAANGEEALRLAAGHAGPIHLVLTDVVMPGIGGKALAEQLSGRRPDIKILFMSGYTDETIAYPGGLEPGVALLQKPFSPLALAHKVRQVLDAG